MFSMSQTKGKLHSSENINEHFVMYANQNTWRIKSRQCYIL